VLTAYYCPEPASGRVQKLLSACQEPVVSWLAEVELVSALSRKVRERGILRKDAERILALYREQVAQGCFRLVTVEGPDYVWAAAQIARFDSALRSLDALHLAVVARTGADLATADRALAQAAKRLDTKVIFVRPDKQ
jgi:predicted nucleic acid-binding protein